MIYQLQEWQRPWLDASIRAWRAAPVGLPWQMLANAGADLFAESMAGIELTDETVEAAVAADAGGPVFHEVVERRPFHRLVRFRRAGSGGSTILLIAPHSGYAAAVLSPLVLALLELGEVLVTDWADGREVPLAAGGLGLAEQTAIVRALMRRHGPRLMVVAVSQAGLPALAAVRELGPAAPAGLVLVGAPIDPALAPTPAQRLLALLPRALAQHQLLAIVPGRFPGAGRRVYPGLFQLLAYGMALPATWLDIQTGRLTELLLGVANGYQRQHEDLHRVIDVPGELFLDLLQHMAQPVWAGAAPSPVPTRLATIEAGADGLVGAGQTHAAHGLLAGGGEGARIERTVEGARHHDLFLGPVFVNAVKPVLAASVAALEG